MKKHASKIKVGDVIMPPPREVRLWMARTCKEEGLPESALYLTVTAIKESALGKDGRRWLRISSLQTPEWTRGRRNRDFVFKVRPETLWLMGREAQRGSPPL